MKTRIAVLVSGGGTNLQALIDANLQAGEIALVVSSRPGVYALERAYKAGIPSVVIAKKGSTQEAFEEKQKNSQPGFFSKKSSIFL